MADHKGRMGPPSLPTSRAHTPQPSLLSYTSDLADERRPRGSFSSTLSSVSSLPDLKKPASKRPKFVQRASHYLTGHHGKQKTVNYFEDIEPKEKPVPLEQIIASFQNELLANALMSFGPDRSHALLRVLEGYMSLKQERDVLEGQLHEVITRHDRNVDMLEEERREWKQDEEVFRLEIKRLEIMIAEGRTGLSQVALARQQTLIRPKGVGRPRGHSDKSDAAKSTVSTVSSKSAKEIKFEVIRPKTPSEDMAKLSKSMKTHRSFLSLDFLPERPPSRLKGLSLADVDIPKHWRKKSEAVSAAPSITSSPAKSFTSDFSSNGGDLLPDEIEQQDLDTQAIEHVAKLMSMAHSSDLEANIQFLKAQTEQPSAFPAFGDTTARGRRLTLSSRSSGDMPTIRRPNLAQRRGTEAMHINTENARPATAIATTSGHSRRPFSFYAGDDQGIMNDLRTAPPNLEPTHSESSYSSQSSPDVPLRRHSSLIPGPVPEHVLARPRREDSSSSVITSFQRSPMGDGRPLSIISTPGSASRPSSAHVMRTASMSLFRDMTNKDLPATPRTASETRPGSVKSQMTTIRGQASVQSLVQDLEAKGSASESASISSKNKKVKKENKKKSPRAGKKEKSKDK